MNLRQIPLLWLLAWVTFVGCIVGGLVYARNEALRTYGSSAAQEEWNAWREDARKMASSDGPVRRRTPKSVEPPALVLMRDYFCICLTISVVLSTVLFATAMFFIRGVASTPAFVDRSPKRRG